MAILSHPGFYSFYPSYMVSRYYTWFHEMGYPNLDIAQYQDGSWSIIEYYKTPLVPSVTPFNIVLGPMHNVEISSSFCEKWVKKLDLQIRDYWDDCERKTKVMMDEKEYLEKHAQDTAERAKNLIMSNPDVVERIYKKGLSEADPLSILKHIPRHQKNGLKGVQLL